MFLLDARWTVQTCLPLTHKLSLAPWMGLTGSQVPLPARLPRCQRAPLSATTTPKMVMKSVLIAEAAAALAPPAVIALRYAAIARHVSASYRALMFSTQNGDETFVDCGGSCPPCVSSCSDSTQNGDENGVDCGGSCGGCGGSICPPVASDGSSCAKLITWLYMGPNQDWSFFEYAL